MNIMNKKEYQQPKVNLVKVLGDGVCNIPLGGSQEEPPFAKHDDTRNDYSSWGEF